MAKRKKETDGALEPSVQATEGISKVRSLIAKRLGIADARDVLPAISDARASVIERVSSGDLGLDIALGGGYPRGRAIKLQGKYSVGKSIALARAFKSFTNYLKEPVALVDVEGTWTNAWLRAMGIDTKLFCIQQVETAEEAVDVMDILMHSGEFSAIGWDSIAASTPKDEYDSSAEEWQRALLARIVNKWTRKMTGGAAAFAKIGKYAPTVFFTNQIRTNTDAKFHVDVTPGGGQQDNFASVIVDFRWIGKENDVYEKDGENEIFRGRGVLATIIKNKTAPPMRKVILKMLVDDYCGHPAYSFFHGDTLLTLALRLGLIVKAGSWYSAAIPGNSEFNDMRWQGEKAAITGIMRSQLGPVLTQVIKDSLDVKVAYQFDDPYLDVVPLSQSALLEYQQTAEAVAKVFS